MIKKKIAALVTAAALAGIAVPAFAVPVETAQESDEIDTVFGGGSAEMRAFVADSVLTDLNRRGINATSVEEWSGLIRAFVTLDDGTQTMQFFRPGSLQQVMF